MDEARVADTPAIASESPFLAEYATEAEDAGADPAAEMVAEFLSELHDAELDRSIAGLVAEASVVAGPLVEGEADGAVEAQLHAYFAPLLTASESLVASAAERLAGVDPTDATEAEIDAALGALSTETAGPPAFELFLGGLKNKLKKVAKKAVGLAKKGIAFASGFVLKPLLAKLKQLVKPLLDKVVKFALDKIPEPYRPLARQLAAGLQGKAQAVLHKAASTVAAAPSTSAAPAAAEPPSAPEPDVAPAPTEPAAPDTAQAQEEFDLQTAEIVFARDPIDREVIGSSGALAPVSARDPIGELERARARFQRELAEADGPEALAPAVENFVPAVLMALRLGIKAIGRPKVVSLLGGLIARFIGPLVGKKNAPALGKVLADVGLKALLQAETTPDDERLLLGEAIAGTVEETVRRVAALPESILDDRDALEAFAHEAFRGAVAANFPPSLVQPELREAEEEAAWVWLPRRGRRLYKKYGRVFDVTISPAIAGAVQGFDGVTLAGFFRDCLRLPPGAAVRARVHVYEAIPRTRLSRIATHEALRGLVPTGDAAPLHPLTPVAASLLLGAPRLGRELDEADPDTATIGARYYFLEVPAAPARALGRPGHLHVAADLARDEVRVCMYLSEVLAQRVATALRTHQPVPPVVTDLRTAFSGASAAMKRDGHARLVRIVGAGAAGGSPALVREARRRVAAVALHWAWAHLARELTQSPAAFIAATDGPEDGVRLAFTFRPPAGLASLKQLLRGRGADGAWPPKGAPAGSMALRPGPRHD